MRTRSAVALYARISRDPDSTMLGVTRQLQDCRKKAAELGWAVADEYVDDDVSAYSTKSRPAYERMLRDLEDGLLDGVIVYHPDRLHRRPIELEGFVQTCTKSGAEVRFVSGPSGFSGDDGDALFMLRIMAAQAANESHAKSRRIKRKFLEVAETGEPYMGGGHRPFGYQVDRKTPYEPEAAPFREAAARVLAGETLYSVAADLESRGITGTKGSKMTPTALRTLLLRERNYGMRVHQKKIIGKGTWEPLISPEDGERLRLLLTDPARRKNRAARRYLLSGMLRCAKCGATLASHPQKDRRRYACGMQTTKSDPCKSTYIAAEPVEQLVADAVLLRLDSPAMYEALEGGPNDAEVAGLSTQIEADQGQMDALARAFAAGEFSLQEWKIARDAIEARLVDNRKRFLRMTQRDAVSDYVGRGKTLSETWETTTLSQQVAVIKALVEHVVIHPYESLRGHAFNPDRVEIRWRL